MRCGSVSFGRGGDPAQALDAIGRPLRSQGLGFPAVALSDYAERGRLGNLRAGDPTALRASRLSDDPEDSLYDLYVSDPFVIVQEPLNEERIEELGRVEGRQAIWPGSRLRVSIEEVEATGLGIGSSGPRTQR